MKVLANGTTIVEEEYVRKFLPHKWPWNLIKQASHDTEQTWSASKLSYFNLLTLGHFPGNRVIPGVVLLEMLNQLCGIRAKMENQQVIEAGSLPMVIGYDGIKFRSQITPGELFTLSVSSIKNRHPFYYFSGKITREDGEIAVAIKEIKGCAVKAAEQASVTEKKVCLQ